MTPKWRFELPAFGHGPVAGRIYDPSPHFGLGPRNDYSMTFGIAYSWSMIVPVSTWHLTVRPARGETANWSVTTATQLHGINHILSEERYLGSRRRVDRPILYSARDIITLRLMPTTLLVTIYVDTPSGSYSGGTRKMCRGLDMWAINNRRSVWEMRLLFSRMTGFVVRTTRPLCFLVTLRVTELQIKPIPGFAP